MASKKYRVTWMFNGLCPHGELGNIETNWLVKALFWLIIFRLKYRIVDLKIRCGHIDCDDCLADWCDRSKAWADIHDCSKCKKHGTMDCPNSAFCQCTNDKPFFKPK